MIDTESAIYTPPNWVERLDWKAVFDNEAPIEVDLGCGKGGFLAWAAANSLATNFLGVDRLLGRLRKVESKLKRRDIGNVRLLRIEGSYFVTYLAPPRSVAAFHIFFPDPWPKRRHHARRLINLELVDHLEMALASRGVVNLATDDADYFAVQQELMNSNGKFLESPALVLPEAAMTEFEKTFQDQGKPIYRARWVKRD